MDNNTLKEKMESTAMKLLDCAEKAAERSAARGTSEGMQNIKDVVDSALSLLDYRKDLMETETIILYEGDKCKIDCGTHGMNVEGPAIIIISKESPVDQANDGRIGNT